MPWSFLTFWYDVFVYVAILLLVSRELYPLVSQSRVLLAHHHHEHFFALQFCFPSRVVAEASLLLWNTLLGLHPGLGWIAEEQSVDT